MPRIEVRGLVVAPARRRRLRVPLSHRAFLAYADPVMTAPRLLARLTVVLTALLLAAPLTTAAALPAPHARAEVTSVAKDHLDAGDDADGDGLVDTRDGCPTVAATTSTGCPSASRQASLTWVKAKGRLEGRITSPVRACSTRARVVLWRVRPNRDVKLQGVDATRRGRYRFTVARGSRYYVSVSPSYASGRAECARATSRAVRAPRR